MSEHSNLPTDVIAAAQSNRKIEAIKLLRQHRGLGLKEAKDTIDSYMASQSGTIVEGDSGGGAGRLVAATVVIGLILLAYFFLK